MTKKIQLTLGSESISTAVSNIFIDKYMAEANGSQVKVYIYLLRCLSDPSMDVSVSDFADKLDETEKDIVRALKYWEKKKLLSISQDAEGQITNLTITQLGGMASSDASEKAASSRSRKNNPVIEEDLSDDEDDALIEEDISKSAPKPSALIKAPNYTPSQIACLKEDDDFDGLIGYVEGKLGVMNQTRLNSLAFIYEIMNMNADLIRYLYDYCIYKGKTGSRYIESVAIAWQDKEIDTVDKARQETFSRSKECAAVKNSFGLSRSLGGVELEFISRWRHEYNMSPELIKAACDRTLIQTCKPDFKYADKILREWSGSQVATLEDIAKLDEEHRSKASSKAGKTPSRITPAAAANRFSQYPQRNYSESDIEELERKKLIQK